MSLSYFFHFLVAMIAITNPLGNLAIFIGLAGDRSEEAQRKIVKQTTLAIFIVLLVTTWCGSFILRLFGISIPAFEIAGGIVITTIGFSMMHAKTSHTAHTPQEHTEAQSKENISVVPLAIPIVAGPGAMTTLILATQQHQSLFDKFSYSLGCFIIAIIIGISMFFSGPIHHMLGEAGIKIASRIMGLILIAIAVGMVLHGIKVQYPMLSS